MVGKVTFIRIQSNEKIRENKKETREGNSSRKQSQTSKTIEKNFSEILEECRRKDKNE